MKRKRREATEKEDIAEDWCFECKDGGRLFLCDDKECPKAYHSHCVGKDEYSMTREEGWTCNWHSCFMCGRKSHFRCYCCPKAVCRFCISKAEFCHVRGTNGLCSHCSKLAILIEEDKDVDSDGEKVDFKDRETYEGLFMEYYRIIQEKEKLKVDNILAAKARKRTGNSDLDEFGIDEDDEVVSEYEKEKCPKQQINKKAFKGMLAFRQKKVRSKIMQFTGWGSTPLIQFLQSIGEDTSERLSERSVEAIILKYISKQKLFHPEKKKKIICDENLQSIFGRKLVNKYKIYELLEAHYSDNLEDSEEDEWEEEEMCYAGCKDKDGLVDFGTRREGREVRKNRESQKHETKFKKENESEKHGTVLTAPQSRFVSITAENIKLVYLRRSLVMELLKHPESFKDKVTGSFVRVKSDPEYYRWTRNSHHLVRVTGIKEIPAGENNIDMILRGSNMPLDIPISMLADSDFLQEECNDLRQKVKGGLVQKISIVELEEKARSLHEDITNHEISRELKILDGRIMQANEKGWRKELFEYLERKDLLQSPSERLRLLEHHPAVIPEELEPVMEEVGYAQKQDETSHESEFLLNEKCKWEDDHTSRENKFHGPLPCQYEKKNLPEVYLGVSPNLSVSKEKFNKMMTPALEDQHDVMLQMAAELCSPPVEVVKHHIPEASLRVSPNHSASEGENNETIASPLEGSPEPLHAYEDDQHNVILQTDAELCSSPAEVRKQNQGMDGEETTSKRQEPFAENAILPTSDDKRSSSLGASKQCLEDQHVLILQIDARLCSSLAEVAKQNQGMDGEETTSKMQELFAENVILLTSDDESSSSSGAREQLLADPEPSHAYEDDQYNVILQTDAKFCSSPAEIGKQDQGTDGEESTSKRQEPFAEDVILLSSDAESTSSLRARKQHLEDPNSKEWLVLGPNGERNKAKYSLSLLRRWSQASSYALKYKAWKEDASEEDAIPLADAIKKAFL